MRLLPDYLRSLAGFLALSLALNWVADATGLRWVNRRSDDLDTYSVLPIYLHFARNPEVVFLGSSHSWCGVHPLTVQEDLEFALERPVEVWNLGLPAGISSQTTNLLDVVFAAGKHPKVLVVECDPTYWRLEDDWQRRNQNIAEILDQDETAEDDGALAQAAFWINRQFYGPTTFWRQLQRLISKRARERAALPGMQGGRWTRREVRVDEALPGPFRPERLELTRADPGRFHEEVLRLINSPSAPDDLAAIFRRAEAEGCRLLFWLTPMKPEYRAIFPDGTLQRHEEWIWPALALENALVANLDLPFNRADEYFWDVDHLGPGGSAFVSRQLAAQIRKLLAE